MSDFYERYKARCEQYKEELNDRVRRGEMDREDADFAYFMGKDDILYAMADEDSEGSDED